MFGAYAANPAQLAAGNQQVSPDLCDSNYFYDNVATRVAALNGGNLLTHGNAIFANAPGTKSSPSNSRQVAFLTRAPQFA